MTDLLILVVLTSFAICGWHYCIQYDLNNEKPVMKEVAWWFKYYGMKITPSFIHKPLFLCPVCMSSIYGTVAFTVSHFFIYPINQPLIVYVPFLLAVAGTNRILTKILHS